MGAAAGSLGTGVAGVAAAAPAIAAAAVGGAVWLIPGFACRRPKLSIGKSAGTCLYSADALVMVVSEEGPSNCVAYLYVDRRAAEKDAGRWKITSRIMFDVTDWLEPKELKGWGPRMPYNTIRSAARDLQQTILKDENCKLFSDARCNICFEDEVPTMAMPCC